MKKFLQKFSTYIFAFYTLWGMVFHVFRIAGIFPNTWIIALFIFIGSQYVLWVSPGNYKKYGPSWKLFFMELLFHVLPVIFIPIEISVRSVVILIVTLFLYYRAHGKKRIDKIYKNMFETIDEILGRKITPH